MSDTEDTAVKSVGFASLTFDIDWAHDDVIADTLSLVRKSGICATWFVTHETPLIDEIRAQGHELGLHPNFNPLLDGIGGTKEDVFARCHSLAPKARAVRSHSVVRSSRLSQMFRRSGMTHESNVFIHPAAGDVRPWRDWEGLIQAPIRWEDDLRLLDPSLGDPYALIGRLPALVVDFHPIHVFLNSTTIDDYEASRSSHQNPNVLLASRRPTGAGGTRDRLMAFLAGLCASGPPILRVSEIAAVNGV